MSLQGPVRQDKPSRTEKSQAALTEMKTDEIEVMLTLTANNSLNSNEAVRRCSPHAQPREEMFQINSVNCDIFVPPKLEKKNNPSSNLPSPLVL
ncbi:hypothetical protein PoB_001451400 [Plakobranchus ocellatus]|uniref:Uncharacterized protein n=1 Tax=Plakobranchus ocellatus TaxID=259542 RepID=A0AAV3Z0T4_9GAST|nr:hypothetical protein PoB_001451400 [Plakobranchus ocellatus]